MIAHPKSLDAFDAARFRKKSKQPFVILAVKKFSFKKDAAYKDK